MLHRDGRARVRVEERRRELRRDGHGWESALVVERTAVDEWTVEFADGEQVWRDHHELRPYSPAADQDQES